MNRQRLLLSLLVTTAALGPEAVSAAGAPPLGPGVVQGGVNPYVVRPRDSLPWIAARFGVHPVRVTKPSAKALQGGLRPGQTLYVDQRRITPRFGALSGVVLNIPEAHVYLVEKGQLVREYPVAVSTAESRMPLGRTRVVSLQKHPTWFVPKSIQQEMAQAGRPVLTRVPPGPSNPLGPRWIGLWDDSFGLHGTNAPTSIKHYASHGCVRFFAHDIEDLYARVAIGTPVHVLYQPVKLAADGDRVWLSAYPDIYRQRYDYAGAVKTLAAQAGVLDRLDWARVGPVLRVRDGIMVEVARPRPAPKPTPAIQATPPAPPAEPSPVPLLDPTQDGELNDIPTEWLIERSPDPWFTAP